MPIGDSSLEDTQKDLNKLKNHKAPGMDEIPAEFLKYGGEALHRRLHQLIMRIWLEVKISVRWKENKKAHQQKIGKKEMRELQRNFTTKHRI